MEMRTFGQLLAWLQIGEDSASLELTPDWLRFDTDLTAAGYGYAWEYVSLWCRRSPRPPRSRNTQSSRSPTPTFARDRVRLAARTSEADAAQRSAEVAQLQSAESQIDAAQAQRRAALSQRQADASQLQADASQQQTDAALRQNDAMQQMANATKARNGQLEDQLQDLNARRTERGVVVTIGDVLFDANRAQLKSAGERSVEKLADFLKQYPQRTARVEGFTDSTENPGLNQELSDRRAASVRAAMVAMGVDRSRIAVRGYGDEFPVASNASQDGRQLNRRVEVILSDDSGVIAPR